MPVCALHALQIHSAPVIFFSLIRAAFVEMEPTRASRAPPHLIRCALRVLLVLRENTCHRDAMGVFLTPRALHALEMFSVWVGMCQRPFHALLASALLENTCHLHAAWPQIGCAYNALLAHALLDNICRLCATLPPTMCALNALAVRQGMPSPLDALGL